MTATARPPTGHGAARAAGAPPDLGAAAPAALGYLADLSVPAPAVRDGRVDHMLRSALSAHGGTPTVPGQRGAMDEVAAAVRTACAHLAAAELEDAYLALRAAVDRLPRSVVPGA
ncbi:MAG: hypothetical protein AVDCRST_MAG54-1815 [uncultured Actinomycetospora sp.]|uniref:Uncharacterized protein n=1 Tax=uncultured Actinomycetospora sp. TaxID=1135996 RepID=A0A6J4ICQ8_9PSEU|nr:MAG: hypothetical protein AVDCRST_MAG54-1815 [uncultured Actinomycetospora sp.]